MPSNVNAAGDYVFKVMLLGEEKVGKTNMVLRYIDNKFEKEHKMTLGVNLCGKHMKDVEGPDGRVYNVSLSIWDVGGQDRWESVRDGYYNGAAGSLLVFDITNYESYNALPKWMKEASNKTKNMGIILIGNKIDQKNKRAVPDTDVIKEWAMEEAGFRGYFETSAKKDINVKEAFYALAQTCLYNAISKK